MARLVLAVALVGMLLPAAGSSANVYSYVDSDGVIRVTNVPPSAQSVAAPSAAAPRRRSAYDGHICVAAQKYGLAPALLKAVMAVESNFDSAATSPKGAPGLMQLMPGTAQDLAVYDLRDPVQNIEGGARYLRILKDRFEGDVAKVLAAYNAGPEKVRRSGGAIPAIPETQAYVRKVLSLRERYQKSPWCAANGSELWTMR